MPNGLCQLPEHRLIEKVPELELAGGAVNPVYPEAPLPTVLELSEDLSSFILFPGEEAGITIERTGKGSRVTLTGVVPEALAARLAAAIASSEIRASFETEVKRHRAVWQIYASPAQRGVPFVVPQLCFKFDGTLDLAEREAFLDANGWNLLGYPAELSEAEFGFTETGVQWEIDLNAAGKIT